MSPEGHVIVLSMGFNGKKGSPDPPGDRYIPAMTMLLEHFAAVERALISQAGIQAGVGHSLHKGTPREAFIRDFLKEHLSERVAIGTGEIISSDSKPGESRNQHDIVIYKRDYPKLHLGGGIDAFLAESVVATIEVKSTLTKSDAESSFKSARKIKQLKQSRVTSFHTGYQPPNILSYIVAYDGPASMKTVFEWLPGIHRNMNVVFFPLGSSRADRAKAEAPAIDAVFVLGKGLMYYDNTPYSFLNDEICAANPNVSWLYGDLNQGGLLFLFTLLTAAVSGISASWWNPIPYLAGLSLPGIQGGKGT